MPGCLEDHGYLAREFLRQYGHEDSRCGECDLQFHGTGAVDQWVVERLALEAVATGFDVRDAQLPVHGDRVRPPESRIQLVRVVRGEAHEVVRSVGQMGAQGTQLLDHSLNLDCFDGSPPSVYFHISSC